MVIFCLCYGMEDTARPTLMSLIPNIFPFSVRYGLLICDSSDCVLHKISFHTDCIITIVMLAGWCYSMVEDAARPADVINHQHSFLLCQTGQGAQ